MKRLKRCTLVGLSYGGMVGFKMAEMYLDLVESLVATCSVMFTESVSNAALERIGFDSWVDYLLPKTADALKVKLDIACYKLPTLPAFFFQTYFGGMYACSILDFGLVYSIVGCCTVISFSIIDIQVNIIKTNWLIIC